MKEKSILLWVILRELKKRFDPCFAFLISIIFWKEYCPTVDDILKIRNTSTGIFQICFSLQQTKFTIIDVSGMKRVEK